jgi:hypothetical protein
MLGVSVMTGNKIKTIRSYLKNSRSRSRAPLNSGIPLLIKKFNVLNKREAIRRRSNKRAMAGQAQKRSQPHSLAD